MAVDIPRGWEITRMVEPEYHHSKCSYATDQMLCDCNILFKHPEQLDGSKFYGAGGAVIELRDGKDPSRAAFESHYLQLVGTASFAPDTPEELFQEIDRDEHGNYAWSSAEEAWSTWQAAKKDG